MRRNIGSTAFPPEILTGWRAQYYSEDLHICGFSEQMRRKRAGSLQPASKRGIESAAVHCHLVNIRGALTPPCFHLVAARNDKTVATLANPWPINPIIISVGYAAPA
jgi:hypothetical protein